MNSVLEIGMETTIGKHPYNTVYCSTLINLNIFLYIVILFPLFQYTCCTSQHTAYIEVNCSIMQYTAVHMFIFYSCALYLLWGQEGYNGSTVIMIY